MTREEAIETLNALPQFAVAEFRDYEEGHVKADYVLRDLLITLGYADVVEAWDKVGKWYS